jgi:hypothetical protein
MTSNQQNRINILLANTPNHIKSRFKYDKTAVISITHFDIAENICAEITRILGTDITILDAFACVGGNTVAFARNFASVFAVELDKNRHNMLVSNLWLFSLKANTICADIFSVDIVADVVFIDPPWDTTDKQKRITIGGKYITDVIAKFDAKLYVLKLPIDYDLGEFADYDITTDKYDQPNRMIIAYLQ